MLSFRRGAVTQLERMPAHRRENLIARLERIAADPFGHHPNVIALKGEAGSSRIRVGDWRAIFHVETNGDVVVYSIGHRREVYR